MQIVYVAERSGRSVADLVREAIRCGLARAGEGNRLPQGHLGWFRKDVTVGPGLASTPRKPLMCAPGFEEIPRRDLMTSSRHASAARAVRALTFAVLSVGATTVLWAQPRAAEPAAVPDAVRIARPTEPEIATARRSLAEFLQTVDPATREILNRYPGLLEVRPPRANTAIVPNLAPFFRAKHEQNLEVARQGDVELLLMGDSITDFWRNTEGNFAGKSVLNEYFGHWKTANFGIAGDTTQGVIHRLQNGEGQGFSPRAIMLMIGTNNTARNTAAEIAEGVGAVVLELRARFPEARILLLGVFPRGEATDPVRGTIADINERIARLHDGGAVHYLDIGDAFLDENGNIPADVMSDGLHPSTRGYRLWAEAVQEPLTQLMRTD
jgi:lysophospholipase L1-like esterase